MTHQDPLSSAWAKMDWANRHVDQVEMAIERIHAVAKELKKGPVSIRGKLTDDGEAWVVYVNSVTNLNKLGLMAGDAVHNFRAVLEHIVWELAFIDGNGAEPKNNVQFPLISRIPGGSWLGSSRHFDREAERLLKPLTKRHRAMIKRHQPYQRWPGGEPHPLLMLSALDNDDKHRVLQPAFAALEEITTIHPKHGRDCVAIGEAINENVIGRPLEVGTKIVTIPIRVTGPNPYVGVKTKASLYIAFRNGIEIVRCLRAISRYVRTIYADFFPEFQTPKAKRVWRPRESRIQTAPPQPWRNLELEASVLTKDEAENVSSDWVLVPADNE